jgi:hypothetical protein
MHARIKHGGRGAVESGHDEGRGRALAAHECNRPAGCELCRSYMDQRARTLLTCTLVLLVVAVDIWHASPGTGNPQHSAERHAEMAGRVASATIWRSRKSVSGGRVEEPVHGARGVLEHPLSGAPVPCMSRKQAAPAKPSPNMRTAWPLGWRWSHGTAESAPRRVVASPACRFMVSHCAT